MTRFQKALRSQMAASKHAFRNVGFHKMDPGMIGFVDLWVSKSVQLQKRKDHHSGSAIYRAGRRG